MLDEAKEMTIENLCDLLWELQNVLGKDVKVVMDITDERHVVRPVTNWTAEPGRVVLL